MSDHDLPARELIDIVAQPGAPETILALHAWSGAATVAELGRPGAADVVKVVPALAADSSRGAAHSTALAPSRS